MTYSLEEKGYPSVAHFLILTNLKKKVKYILYFLFIFLFYRKKKMINYTKYIKMFNYFLKKFFSLYLHFNKNWIIYLK